MDASVAAQNSDDATVYRDSTSSRERSLANLRKFQPGQSGNPRGRPKKDIDLAALAQKHAQQAVLTLVEVMTNTESPPSARVSAAGEILDRGFGRAPQSLDVEHKLSLGEEFEAFIREMTDRRAGRVIDIAADSPEQ